MKAKLIANFLISSILPLVSWSAQGDAIEEFPTNVGTDTPSQAVVEGELIIQDDPGVSSGNALLQVDGDVDIQGQLNGMRVKELPANLTANGKWWRVAILDDGIDSGEANRAQFMGTLYAQTDYRKAGSRQYIAHFSFGSRGNIFPLLNEFGSASIEWRLYQDNTTNLYELWVQQSDYSDFMQFAYKPSAVVTEIWTSQTTDPSIDSNLTIEWSSLADYRQGFNFGSLNSSDAGVTVEGNFTVNGELEVNGDSSLLLDNDVNVFGRFAVGAEVEELYTALQIGSVFADTNSILTFGATEHGSGAFPRIHQMSSGGLGHDLALGSASNNGRIRFFTGSNAGASSLLGTASNTEKMTILPNGNVGIGITDPSKKLHVSGGNVLVESDTWTNLSVKSTAVGKDPKLELADHLGNDWEIRHDADDNNLEFRWYDASAGLSYASTRHQFYTNGDAKFNGNLELGGALVVGTFDNGTNPVADGTIRWNSAEDDFEGSFDGGWVSLTAGSSGGSGSDSALIIPNTTTEVITVNTDGSVVLADAHGDISMGAFGVN